MILSSAFRTATFISALVALGGAGPLAAQADSIRTAAQPDTTSVQGSVYSRPFITSAGQISIGGYVEGNTNYFREDGVSEGFSMELRRFNIFLFSPVAARLRFFAELEFEHGTEEIALETAQLDFQIAPGLGLRAGIILPPIGGFNQNHDSPRWEFVDRPLVSTQIIPSTLSEVGFGAFGRLSPARGVGFTYDAYLTNGLGEGILLNEDGRTSLPAGKSADQFAEDNNGSPAFSARGAVQHSRIGELGVSYYGGAYNRFREEGVEVDERRDVTIGAIDFSTGLGRLAIRGEMAQAWIDVPPSLTELMGGRQRGGHLDLVFEVLRRRLLGLQRATLNAALRLEYVDFNVGKFTSTGRTIRDDVTAIVPGVSFRPAANTVFKANYRWQRSHDVLGNPPSRLGGYQVGFTTYF
ncbi:MAG: hypothetical protein ACSLFK_05815 [Gemmatimonadaceae bacterium]